MYVKHSDNKVMLCVTLLTAIFQTTAASRAAVNCKYGISATIDQDNATVETTTKLVYHNYGAKVLNELVFRFTPDQEQKEMNSVKVHESIQVADESGQSLQVSPFVRAGITIEDYFVVTLPKPVKPGKSVRLEAKSKAAVLQRCGARIKNLRGCWHPKILDRVRDDWQIGVEEFADYRVTVGPVTKSLIPISGKIVERRKDENGLWTITCEASNIPDFSMVLSHADNVISEAEDGVTINCFYVENKDRAEKILRFAKDVVGFYRGMYGFYPGNLLNIVAYDSGGGGGGPIGCNIVYVLKDKLDWGVAHEIGHEYWGWNWVTGVGSTDDHMNWLCLGMGLWSDRQYLEARNKTFSYYSVMLNEYLDAVRAGFSTKLENTTEEDLKPRMREKNLLHDKGYAIALMLEDLLGKDVLREIAKTTLEQYAHQAIDAEDFQGVCEQVSGQDLDWFFHQWLYTNDSLDYTIVEAKTTQVGSKQQIVVSIEAKGAALMPVNVMLELTDGSVARQRLPRTKQRCTFTSDKPWRRLIIDPDNYLPDKNRFDNALVALDGKVAEHETRAIKEFRKTRKKILAGDKFKDTSTPLGTLLTVLSYLHARDADAFKRINRLSHDDENLDPKLTDKEMADLEHAYAEFGILRAPLPPDGPQENTYWPVYVNKHNRAKLAGSFVFVYRDEKWQWFGNVQSPDDWRSLIQARLSDWEEKEKYKGDPFLTTEITEAEAHLIERFRRIKEKIRAGQKYEDMSTPVDLLLTMMSALYSRDTEALKRAIVWARSQDDEEAKRLLQSWDVTRFTKSDILRAPLPPDKPEEGTVWPIYRKHPHTGRWDDTIVPVFWKGKWQWSGNIGRPRDWRPFVPSKKRQLRRNGK